ncbi:cytochrome P450 [Streptomyces fenghuangensis]
MTSPPPPPGCPAHTPPPYRSGPSVAARLYGPDFAARPEAVYQALRALGPVVWVDLAPETPALLVVDYAACLEVLRDAGRFSKDSRRWQALNQGQVPPDSPALALMAWRPSALFTDGPEHARLYTAITDSLGQLDPHVLHDTVIACCEPLVEEFGPRGRADLVTDFAMRVPGRVLARLFGCPEDVGARMVRGVGGLIDATGARAQAASQDLSACLAGLVALKRDRPGDDLTSWMLQHSAGLSDQEMVDQLVLLVGAGTVPTAGWIASGLKLMLGDPRFAGTLKRGTVPVQTALDEVLWRNAPMANFSIHYAIEPTTVGGTPVPAGVPLVISHASANLQTHHLYGETIAHNRAHLAWSAGPHACPAQDPATAITKTAIETVLDRVPGMRLTVRDEDVPYRPGPFHRTPASLPVAFAPVQPSARFGDHP